MGVTDGGTNGGNCNLPAFFHWKLAISPMKTGPFPNLNYDSACLIVIWSIESRLKDCKIHVIFLMF